MRNVEGELKAGKMEGEKIRRLEDKKIGITD